MPDPKLPSHSPLASHIGLYEGENFRLTTGLCGDCAAIHQALWYFRGETIAAPKPGVAVAGFAPNMSMREDLAQWAATHPRDEPLDLPPLIWIGSREVVPGARLSSDGSSIDVDAGRLGFELVPKIALNRSYYDASSASFLSARPLRLRGETRDHAFVARTIWPEDFRLDSSVVLQGVEPSARFLRDLVRAEPRGGAQSPFASTLLWERSPGAARMPEGAPVLALMLNGAQGDDDEAHGGHFALVTGRTRADGAIGDWLTNNFYTLDLESEKGILASMLPLDDYLADLNSGQAWYRPSYLLVAVLRDAGAARRIQDALARAYNQLYRHQLVYRHSSMNCASISVDVLRALGWRIQALGATSWTAAWLGFPYFLLRNRSLAKAAQSFEYLTEDRTRLLPAVAFEEIGADLMRLALGVNAREPTPLETRLAQDIEAIHFLRVPQLPSSRRWGDYPVATVWEYAARLPSDLAKQEIVPVPARPFPERLRDPDLLPPPRPRSDYAIAVWALLSVVGIPWLLWRWWRRTRGAS
jgi:hypothetical protein